MESSERKRKWAPTLSEETGNSHTERYSKVTDPIAIKERKKTHKREKGHKRKETPKAIEKETQTEEWAPQMELCSSPLPDANEDVKSVQKETVGNAKVVRRVAPILAHRGRLSPIRETSPTAGTIANMRKEKDEKEEQFPRLPTPTSLNGNNKEEVEAEPIPLSVGISDPNESMDDNLMALEEEVEEANARWRARRQFAASHQPIRIALLRPICYQWKDAAVLSLARSLQLKPMNEL